MTQPTVCPKVCRECPFRRESAPGYLGAASWNPRAFLSPHMMPNPWPNGSITPLPCHMTVDWRRKDAQARALEAPLCRGFLTMLRNQNFLPADPRLAEARNGVEPDETIFGHVNEFIAHHEDLALAAQFRA